MSEMIPKEYYDKALFDHDVDLETGIVTRRTPAQGARVGRVVGSLGSRQYLNLGVGVRGVRKFISLHRLVWYAATGELPDEIDHDNQNKSDNSLKNLRPATRSQQQLNTPLPKDNKTGHKGVFEFKNGRRKKWLAYITLGGKKKNLGYFHTKEEAIEARKAGEKKYYDQDFYDDGLGRKEGT